MRKILIIGCPGSGKSTFARRLRDKTGLPLYYLDMLWHQPDKTTVSPQAFAAELAKILLREEWIVDGNYDLCLDTRLQACDTVFLFDIPLADCLAGAAKRIGVQRQDLPWLEEEFDAEFRRYILAFPQTKLPALYASIEKYPRLQVLIFHSHAEADAFLDAL